MSDPDTGKQDDNAALIALRDLPSQLRDDAIGHAPRRAERLLAAADEIERLERELAEARDELAHARSTGDEAALEVQAWKRDAERYRWLRDNSDLGRVPWITDGINENRIATVLEMESADAAIDAAMAAAPAPGPER